MSGRKHVLIPRRNYSCCVISYRVETNQETSELSITGGKEK